MNPLDLKDLEQLALLAELGRPLAHECNNFLNNLLLQLAISEKTLPEPFRAEWAHLRREAKKLANLLQQWQRHRQPSVERQRNIELNQLVHETVEALGPEAGSIQLIVRQNAEPLWLTGFSGEARRLCFLVLRHAIAALVEGGGANHGIEIQLESNSARIILRFLHVGPADSNLRWTDFDETSTSDRGVLSLPALACKSLVERLEGRVHIENGPSGHRALAFDFPLAQVKEQ
jgi:hypothetical protein